MAIITVCPYTGDNYADRRIDPIMQQKDIVIYPGTKAAKLISESHTSATEVINEGAKITLLQQLLFIDDNRHCEMGRLGFDDCTNPAELRVGINDFDVTACNWCYFGIEDWAKEDADNRSEK